MSDEMRTCIDGVLKEMMKPVLLCTCEVGLAGENYSHAHFARKCHRCGGMIPEEWLHNGIMPKVEWAPGFEPKKKKLK